MTQCSQKPHDTMFSKIPSHNTSAHNITQCSQKYHDTMSTQQTSQQCSQKYHHTIPQHTISRNVLKNPITQYHTMSAQYTISHNVCTMHNTRGKHKTPNIHVFISIYPNSMCQVLHSSKKLL